MAHYIEYLPDSIEFYFGSGLDGGWGTNGYSYGYVMVRTTEAGVEEYGYSFDGYLCDDDLGTNEIYSICNSLGFYDWEAIVWEEAQSVNRAFPFSLDDLECDHVYHDPAINCTYRYPEGSNDCYHREAVWLSCDGNGINSEGTAVYPVLTDGHNLLQFMLTGDTQGYLYNPHGWVCDHSQFGDSEAEVICYEMGLGLDHYHKDIDLDAVDDTTYWYFGVNYYPMGLDHFTCTDNPSGLTSCSYTYEYDGYCSYQQGLYLDCSAPYVDLSPSASDDDLSASASDDDLSDSASNGLELWIFALIIGLSIVLLLFVCGCCYLTVRGRRLEKQNDSKAEFNHIQITESFPSNMPGAGPGQEPRDTFGIDPGTLPTETWESEDPIGDTPNEVYITTSPPSLAQHGSDPSKTKGKYIPERRGEDSLIYKRPSALNTHGGTNRGSSRAHEGEESQ